LRRLSVSAATRASPQSPRELRALHRQTELAGKRVEQVPLFGQQDAPAVDRQHREHAQALPVVAEWHVERRRRRQRVRAEPRAPAVIDDPLRDRKVRVRERSLDRWLERILQPAVRIREQHDGRTIEHFGHVTYGNARHVRDTARRRQLAAHGVQKRGTSFARPATRVCCRTLATRVGDHHRHDQHDGERHEILEVVHRERITLRHEAEIEHDHVGDGGNDGGSAAEADTRDGRAEHVGHHDVGELEVRVHRERDGRADQRGAGAHA
jgi:hypothetical protein